MENPLCFQAMVDPVEMPGGFKTRARAECPISNGGRCQAMPGIVCPKLLGDLGADGSGVKQPMEPRKVQVFQDLLGGLEQADPDLLCFDAEEEPEGQEVDYLSLLLEEPKTIPMEAMISDMALAKAEYFNMDALAEYGMVTPGPLPKPRSALVQPLLGNVGYAKPDFSSTTTWTEAEMNAAAQLHEMKAMSSAPSFGTIVQEASRHSYTDVETELKMAIPVKAKPLSDNMVNPQAEVSLMDALPQVQMARSEQLQEPRGTPANALYGNMGHPQPLSPYPYMYPGGEAGMGISEPSHKSRKVLVEKSADAYSVHSKKVCKLPSDGSPEQSSGFKAAKVKDFITNVKRALRNAATAFGCPGDDSDDNANNDNKENDREIDEKGKYKRSLDELSWVGLLFFFILVIPGFVTCHYLVHNIHVESAGSRAMNDLSQARHIFPYGNVSNDATRGQILSSATGGGSMIESSPEAGIETTFLLATEQFVGDREMPNGASDSLLGHQVHVRGEDYQNVLRIRLESDGAQGEKNWQQFSFAWETSEVFSLGGLTKGMQCPEDFGPEWIDENGPTKFLHHPLHSVNYQEGHSKNLDGRQAGSACVCRRCGPTPEEPKVHRRHGFPLDMMTSREETQETLPSSDEVPVRGKGPFNQHNESTGLQQGSLDLLPRRILRSTSWKVRVVVSLTIYDLQAEQSTNDLDYNKLRLLQVVHNDKSTQIDVDLAAALPSMDTLESVNVPKVSVNVESMDEKGLKLELVIAV